MTDADAKMIKSLGNCLYWQTLVNRTTTDQKQRERTAAAIEKLTEQIRALNDTIRD